MKHPRIAILIDGDNASPDTISDVIKFVKKHGRPVVKRIYGDCSNKHMAKWFKPAREYSFRIIEVLANVKGKNSTDISLIIDAMDFLHSGSVDGFCIVSSDADFTLLAQRMRESGFLVLGYGDSKTPAAFVNSCKKFCFSNFETERHSGIYELLNKDAPLFDIAFRIAGKGNSEVSLSLIGTELKNLIPYFKSGRYGFKTLGEVFLQLPNYELFKVGDKKNKDTFVRKISDAKIEE